MMEKQRSVIKNYFYTAFYQVVAILVPLITTPYLARVLGAEGIGQYAYSYSLLSLMRLFAVLGFNVYGQREIAKHRNNAYEKSKVFWEIMIAKSIPFAISFVFYCLLALVFVANKYSVLLWCFLPNLISYCFDVTFLLQGDEAFKTISLRDFVVKVVGIACIFIFVKKQSDVWIYALNYGLITFVSVATLIFYVRKHIRKIPFSEIKPFRHFKYAVILFVPTIAASTFTIIDKGMIQWITKDDFEIGYYEEAQKIITLLFGLISAIGTVMSPRNSQIYASGGLDKLKQNVNRSISFSFLLALPLCFGLIAISNVFVPVFFGAGYDKTNILLCIMAPIIVFMAITNALGMQYLIPTGQELKYSLAIILSSIVNVAANIPLIYFFGSIGAAVASLFSEIAVSTVLLFVCRKILSIKFIISNGWKNLISAIFMSLIVHGTSLIITYSFFHLFLLICEGVAVYFGVNYLLGDKNVITILDMFYSKLPWRTKK